MALIVAGLALLVAQGVAGGRRRVAGGEEELVVQPIVD